MSTHPYCEPTNILTVPLGTLVGPGDTVNGTGVKLGTIVTSVKNIYEDEEYIEVTLNQTLWDGETTPYGFTNFNVDNTCQEGWQASVVFGKFILGAGAYNVNKTLSFKEQVKGWVSFKSFTPENAISMANDYYTFFNGNLYEHHIENVNRNTFYEADDSIEDPFTSSSVSVVLNDSPSNIKEFNTLNYEGSQAKVEVFEEALRDNFDGTTSNYNDQEYYNLAAKRGWHVENVETNEEDGHIDEFLEKEGKWFNYIKREIDLNLSKADTGDFSFQGIGFAGNITGGGKGSISGCTDRTATNYNSLATIDDGSCVYGEVYGCMDATATNYNSEATIDDGSCIYDVYGCTNPIATNYNLLATIDDGSCVFPQVTYGCTDPLANNYNPNATVDDGSCTFDVLGCTYPGATNYNPLATIDDGSCKYTQILYGCMDPLAVNYYPGATVDDGSCFYETVPATCENIFNIGAIEACDDFLCLLYPGLDPACSNLPFPNAMALAAYWANEISSAADGNPTNNTPSGGYVDQNGATIAAITAQEMYDLLYSCCVSGVEE